MRTLVYALSAYVVLATTSFAQNNTANLSQIGNAQEASVSQIGNTLTATISQNGNDQIATITQKGFGYSEAIITQGQDTDDNQATISQIATGTGGSYAVISQVRAVSNQATINQSVTMMGSGNFATITQGSLKGVELAGSDGSVSVNNQAIVQIEGSNNRTRLLQVGDNNTATTSQYGEGNVIRGLPGNPAGTNSEEAAQLGLGNSLTIVQSSAFGASFGINAVNVYQSGMGNVSNVNQTNQ